MYKQKTNPKQPPADNSALRLFSCLEKDRKSMNTLENGIR
mgnify:CR=1 FL=1